MISDEQLKKRLKKFDLESEKLEKTFKDNEKIRKEFVEKYPLNSLKNLTKETYSIGKGNEDSFCYWVEQKTSNLGSILGANVSKFGLWYSEIDNAYKTTKEFRNDADSAIISIRERLDQLTSLGESHDLDGISKIQLSPKFKGKILYLYFPEKYLNIFSEVVVDYFLEIVGVNIGDISTVERKRDAIIHWKTENETMKQADADSWSNDMLTHFLYEQFKDKYAVIMKVNFDNKSKLSHETYLDGLERGEWKDWGWGTPKNYLRTIMKENERGKLILFDRNIRKITAEFEVNKVEHISSDENFPFRNFFDQASFRRFEPPIGEDIIMSVPGLNGFNSNQSAHRILSTYQYLHLIDAINDYGNDIDNKMKTEHSFRHAEAADQELGLLGEEFVLKCEKEKLKRSPDPNIAKLANKVERVADREHYDVKSFDTSGREIIIEVKTTVSSWDATFYITSSERQLLNSSPEKYLLYRVYEFDKQIKNGKIMVYDSKSFDPSKFEPILFKGNLMRKGTDYEV